MPKNYLPKHTEKKYEAVNECIYCGAKDELTDEHIIPLALGGRWILPQASCKKCSGITSGAELVCLRTILGALRLYYSFPTRRPKSKPKSLPLKIKYISQQTNWSYMQVDQEEYPFLIVLPLYDLPHRIKKVGEDQRKDSSTKHFWTRGGNLGPEQTYLQRLCEKYRVPEIMPEGECKTHEFSLMLAKIAHSYAVAELGSNKFNGLLVPMIIHSDTSMSAHYIGGELNGLIPATRNLHEVSFAEDVLGAENLIVVKIRLLAALEAPIYYAIVGEK